MRGGPVWALLGGAAVMSAILLGTSRLSDRPPQPTPAITPVITPIAVPSTPPSDCGGSSDLVVATGDDISSGSMRREVFDSWNQTKPPGFPRVKLLELSDSTDLRRAQMAALAQVGSCAYDVLVLDVAWVAEFARHGYIQPIELKDSDRFLDGPLKAGQIDGQQFGVPFAADAPLEYHRLDQPKGGYLLQLSDREMGTVNFLEMIELGGGAVLDGDDRTDVTLSDREDATWKALTDAEHLTFDGETRVPVLHESLHMDEDQSTAALRTARSATGRSPTCATGRSPTTNWPPNRGCAAAAGICCSRYAHRAEAAASSAARCWPSPSTFRRERRCRPRS